MIHYLKCWPCYFEQLQCGTKLFELRKNDRNFKLCDTLVLQEWDPTTGTYTGSKLNAMVSYLLRGPLPGLEEGYVIMSLSL